MTPPAEKPAFAPPMRQQSGPSEQEHAHSLFSIAIFLHHRSRSRSEPARFQLPSHWFHSVITEGPPPEHQPPDGGQSGQAFIHPGPQEHRLACGEEEGPELSLAAEEAIQPLGWGGCSSSGNQGGAGLPGTTHTPTLPNTPHPRNHGVLHSWCCATHGGKRHATPL